MQQRFSFSQQNFRKEKRKFTSTMAPNGKNLLAYENDDVELLSSFSKKGKRRSWVEGMGLIVANLRKAHRTPNFRLRLQNKGNLAHQWQASSRQARLSSPS
jgi:hypothetical protein